MPPPKLVKFEAPCAEEPVPCFLVHLQPFTHPRSESVPSVAARDLQGKQPIEYGRIAETGVAQLIEWRSVD